MRHKLDFLNPWTHHNYSECILQVQRDLGVILPIVVMLSLLGVMGFSLITGQASMTEGTIDRDALICPDALIEDFGVSIDGLLRPAFDFIWQAAGEAESPNYDADDRWKERLGI